MTQHEKILNILNSGKNLTAAKAVKLGITNLAARVAELRSQGYSIYTNYRKHSDTFYRIGRPTRSTVALAYATAGSASFQG